MKNYFKKFSIMFVMLLVLIGVGAVQNETIANAATIGQALTAPEAGWKRISCSYNSNIEYGKDFFDYKSSGLYHNYESESYIKLYFYGTKIRIMDDMCDNRKQGAVIYLDNNKGENISSYKSSGIIHQGMVYEKTGLEQKLHSVYIKIPYEKSKYFTMFNIDLDENGYLANPKETIYLNKSSTTLTEETSEQLIATTIPVGIEVVWTSSNSAIATVDSTGKVVGVKEGQATITATTSDGLTAICIVNVTKKAEQESISLNKSTTNLIIDDSETLIATTTPAGINVKWSSSDPTVATVDSNGKVTAVGVGTATITAITSDGSNLSAACVITVTPKGTDPASEEKIVNIAHAKGDNTNNPGGEVTIIFHGTADTILSVVKTADVKDVWIGDNFTYTLVITNTGTKTAKAVVVNDPAPNHIDFNVSGVTTTQGTVDSSSTSKNIIVNVGDILPGGTVTIKIPSTVIA
ncbi:Ig-like domain-containing protein [Clostridium saccharoperbutylacetonicum]|uniref:Ig-like domain-containing protein n=1 Tax=Clostridium saccharoperbutylacetonicum TaxID=36745 RepID=UPI000983CA18|nr:Ig-like domain-containing protein [Clostridium saccharoperbutylacetonicum]AQR95607.1 bacterial Ig-like domain protein [Clostridium saccharoperbutylacetonicum]NSB31468.1 putative repeat protein (TIGR01451 family) [Clostridium saccharoperbutylacetonicum]